MSTTAERINKYLYYIYNINTELIILMEEDITNHFTTDRIEIFYL